MNPPPSSDQLLDQLRDALLRERALYKTQLADMYDQLAQSHRAAAVALQSDGKKEQDTNAEHDAAVRRLTTKVLALRGQVARLQKENHKLAQVVRAYGHAHGFDLARSVEARYGDCAAAAAAAPDGNPVMDAGSKSSTTPAKADAAKSHSVSPAAKDPEPAMSLFSDSPDSKHRIGSAKSSDTPQGRSPAPPADEPSVALISPARVLKLTRVVPTPVAAAATKPTAAPPTPLTDSKINIPAATPIAATPSKLLQTPTSTLPHKDRVVSTDPGKAPSQHRHRSAGDENASEPAEVYSSPSKRRSTIEPFLTRSKRSKNSDATASSPAPTASHTATPATSARAPTSVRPTFKYTEVVRKKDERRKMHGADCPCCTNWYKMTGFADLDGNALDIGAHKDLVSRHRNIFDQPQTPDGFWDVGFPSTQDVQAAKEKRDTSSTR
ncbi:hypothetical protein RI367_001105 [Sorochytrium milnesiophthora]